MNNLTFWYWTPQAVKAHTAADFGRYLMRVFRAGDDRKRIRWSAVYKDRYGKLTGFDFIIPNTERVRIENLYKAFEYEKSGTENGESRAESIAEITQSGFK